jgi:hypothetical protein
MSNSSLTNELPQDLAAEKNPRVNHEMDLIEIVGFLWHSRFFVFGGAVLGVLGAASIWVANRSQEDLSAGTNIIWNAKLAAANGNDADLLTIPAQLSSFLKTRMGSSAFYEGLAKTIKLDENTLNDLSTKQQTGDGLVKSLGIDNSQLSINIESNGILAEEEVRKALPLALNTTIDIFNNNLASMHGNLLEEGLEIQLKMSEIKIKSFQLFDRYVEFSPPVEKTIVESMIKELANNSSPDAITFLLAAVPNSAIQKSHLVAEYKKLHQANEALISQSKALAKSIGVEYVTPLATLGPVSELTTVSSSALRFSNSLWPKLPVLLILGSLLGGLVGTFLALLRSFWKNNRQRLKAVLQENS